MFCGQEEVTNRKGWGAVLGERAGRLWWHFQGWRLSELRDLLISDLVSRGAQGWGCHLPGTCV